MKLKRGEYIFVGTMKAPEPVRSFLTDERKGVQAGNRVLLDLLPISRKTKDLHDFIHWLFQIYDAKRSGGIDMSFNVDGRGRIMFLSVPEEWVEIVIKGAGAEPANKKGDE